MIESAAVSPVRFKATVSAIDGSTIIRLPASASQKLPSRGQVAVRGAINGHEFETVLEPDGRYGHWIRVDGELQRAANVHVGDIATVEVASTKDWPEPRLPRDFEAALAASPVEIRYLWEDITPMARWEWVRWVNATADRDTRRRRVEVSISKMKSGKRRPCCFNLSSCTDPQLARNGKLREA